jgi:hypothetical protein
LESSPRPPSHWLFPCGTWQGGGRIRWLPCAAGLQPQRSPTRGAAEAAQRLRPRGRRGCLSVAGTR